MVNIRQDGLRTRLRQARGVSNMTQTQAADAFGDRPQSFISKLEAGELRATFVDVVRLARIYSVPVTYFAEVVE